MNRAQWKVVVGISGLLLVAAGCGDNGTNFTCGAGTVAQDGVCVPTGESLTCGTGTHAANGVCVPDEVQQDAGAEDATPEDGGQTVPGEIGAACTGDNDCQSGFCATTALDPRLVGGYCTKILCSDANPCPSGAVCLDPGVGYNACFRYCEPGTDVCRAGYACQPESDDPAKAFCAPKCTSSSACPAGAVCDATHGICVPPPTCDPASPSCATGTHCQATSESPTGGYCFPDCTGAGDCKADEVCQPLNPGSTDGLCVPPPCSVNADCPAGAVCAVQHDGLKFCAPPDTCTTTCTDEALTCYGGLCLAACDAGAAGDTACAAIHPELTCADSFGVCLPACGTGGTCSEGNSCLTSPGDNVCLPTGVFPTSPCLPAGGGHSSPYCLPVGGSGSVTQSCVNDMCVVDCDEANVATGDALCQAVSSALTCMPTSGTAGSCVYACVSGACPAGFACYDAGSTGHQNACLPTGSFPGSPCKTDGSCDDVGGRTQACVSGTCLPTCTTETHCTNISTALTCVEAEGICLPACVSGQCATGYSCLTSENACLPTGSFPGSPCRNGTTCDNVNGIPQACVDAGGGAVCVPTCANEGQCKTVNAVLTCVEAEGLCFPACSLTSNCNPAAVGAGFSCFTTYDACLPSGTFPGSPCLGDTDCHPVGGAPQACIGDGGGNPGQCSVKCTPGDATYGDSLCRAVNEGLKCMPISTTESSTGGICNYACIAGSCDHLGTGYTCQDTMQVCLPTGTFPGSPCLPAGGGHGSPWCATVGGGATAPTQSCVNSMCVVDCDEAQVQTGDALCAAVDPSLTCMPQSGTVGLCVYSCAASSCPSGYFCYDPGASGHQHACLPDGTVPFNPCRLDGSCANFAGQTMSCQKGMCLVNCNDGSGGDTLCGTIGTGLGVPLVCDGLMTQACVPSCSGTANCAGLGTGYSCLAPQNACLPTGSFPTSPCRTSAPKCDSDVAGNPNLNMACANLGAGNACYFDCSWDQTVCTPFAALGMGVCHDLGYGSVCGP